MPKKIILSFLLLFSLSLQGFAQAHFKTDTLAFRQFWEKSPFPVTNMALIQALWVELKPKKFRIADYWSHTPIYGTETFTYQQENPSYNPNYDLMGSSSTRFFMDHVFSDPRFENANARTLMVMLKWELKYQQDSVRKNGFSPDSIKSEMVRRLKAFDRTAYYKPIFYADIYSRYKGNYKAYVDALFKKSLITSPKRLRRFTAYARKKMLLKDMGFQFTLSLALYELWMRQVKDGTRVLAEEP